MKLTALLALLTCFFLVGCHKGGDIVGKWTGAITPPAGKANDPGAEMAKKMLGDISLELKADKTYNMTMIFPIEGTWEQSGSTVTLKMTKMMGQDIATLKKTAESQGKSSQDVDKPLVLTVSADGRSMTGSSDNGQGGGITFTRAAG